MILHGIQGAEPRPDNYGDKNRRRTAMQVCLSSAAGDAGKPLWPLIGRRPCKGGSAEHTSYIRQDLRVGQSVATVPVTGSLVCILSWLNLRDTAETVIFPRRRTSGDTGWINRTVFQMWLQMIAGDCNMNAAPSVLPWDAPEAVVNVSSAGSNSAKLARWYGTGGSYKRRDKELYPAGQRPSYYSRTYSGWPRAQPEYS